MDAAPDAAAAAAAASAAAARGVAGSSTNIESITAPSASSRTHTLVPCCRRDTDASSHTTSALCVKQGGLKVWEEQANRRDTDASSHTTPVP